MTMFVCSSYLRATDVTHVTTYKYYRGSSCVDSSCLSATSVALV